MEEEADILSNLCGDLVSLTRLEPALLHLFRETPSGAWSSVRELYGIAGQPNEAIKAELVAVWLPPPNADPGGAVVLFFDEESMWSMTAWYNVARLLDQHSHSSATAVG